MRFHEFKTADNGKAGIEVTNTGSSDDTVGIYDALLIGKTLNAPEGWSKSPHGIITPKNENFVIRNAKFFNYNFNGAAAIGSCS